MEIGNPFKEKINVIVSPEINSVRRAYCVLDSSMFIMMYGGGLAPIYVNITWRPH